MTRPAPTLVKTGAKPAGGSARCEWQSRQPRTPSTKYLPRANRSGVGSKWRSVSTRDFAPSTGLQPTVTVIKTASSEARAVKLQVAIFFSLLALAFVIDNFSVSGSSYFFLRRALK
jgi:hypothetical protein